MYKMAGQCSDGGQWLERNSRGQSRLEESCDGSQCTLRTAVLIMMRELSPETTFFDAVQQCKLHLTFVSCHIPLPLLNIETQLCQTKMSLDISSLSHYTYFGVLYHP
jgi:hypothetical protein